jgi:hypothetical protein
MSTRTWQDNAAEFRELDRGTGWPFAVIVACSATRKGTGGKASLTQFADAVGSSGSRIGRYLDAWMRAAAKGLVPNADTLTPADVHRVRIPDAAFSDFYDASDVAVGGHRNPAHAVDAIARHGAGAVVDAMTPAQRSAVAAAIVEVSEPEVVAEVHRAARERIFTDHATLNDQRAAAAHEQRESRQARHTLRFLEADEMLMKARRLLREAATTMHGVDFTPDERDGLLESIATVRTALDVATTAASGDPEVDWDAELSRMGASE